MIAVGQFLTNEIHNTNIKWVDNNNDNSNDKIPIDNRISYQYGDIASTGALRNYFIEYRYMIGVTVLPTQDL